MIEITSDEIIIKQVFVTSNLSNIEDELILIDVDSTLNNYTNRLIRIGSETRLVIDHVGEKIYIDYPFNEPVGSGDDYDISFSYQDLTVGTDLIEIVPDKVFQIEKDLIVNNSGFFYIYDITLFFKNCIFQVADGGHLQMGTIVWDQKTPISGHGVNIKFFDGASYGRDAWRYVGKSVADATGTLVLSGVDVNFTDSIRSDFDFYRTSSVYLYNTNISGSIGSYHHLNSANMHLYNVKYTDATSVEFQYKPVNIYGFQTVRCVYGLSFYPPSSTDYVQVSNLFIYEPQTLFIKRNHNSSLQLINTDIPTDPAMTGSAPIQFAVSHQNRVLLNDSNPAVNATVSYVFEPLLVSSYSSTTLSFQNTVEFVKIKVGDYIQIQENNEMFKELVRNDLDLHQVTSIPSLNQIIVTPSIQTSFSSPVVNVVKRLTTDSEGNLDEILIPEAYIARSSNIIEYNGNIGMAISYGGTIEKHIIDPLKNSFEAVYLDTCESYKTVTIIDTQYDEIVSTLDTINDKKCSTETDLSDAITDIKNHIPDHSNLATKTNVDDAAIDIKDHIPDHTNLATKNDINDAVANININIPDHSNLATKTDVTNIIVNLATKTDIDDAVADINNTVPDHSTLTTKTDLAAAVTDIKNNMGVDNSSLATKIDLDNAVVELKNNTTSLTTQSDLAAAVTDIKNSMGVDNSSLATKIDVDNAVASINTSIDSIDNSLLATKTNVDNAVIDIKNNFPDQSTLTTKIDLAAAVTDIKNNMGVDNSDLATKIDIDDAVTEIKNHFPDHSNLATKTDVSTAITNITTKTDLADAVTDIKNNMGAIDNSSLATKTDVAVAIVELKMDHANLVTTLQTNLATKTDIDSLLTTDQFASTINTTMSSTISDQDLVTNADLTQAVIDITEHPNSVQLSDLDDLVTNTHLEDQISIQNNDTRAMVKEELVIAIEDENVAKKSDLDDLLTLSQFSSTINTVVTDTLAANDMLTSTEFQTTMDDVVDNRDIAKKTDLQALLTTNQFSLTANTIISDVIADQNLVTQTDLDDIKLNIELIYNELTNGNTTILNIKSTELTVDPNWKIIPPLVSIFQVYKECIRTSIVDSVQVHTFKSKKFSTYNDARQYMYNLYKNVYENSNNTLYESSCNILAKWFIIDQDECEKLVSEKTYNRYLLQHNTFINRDL
jgi:hypothetical protein